MFWVFNDCTGCEPCVVVSPTIAHEFASAVETIGAIEDDNNQAARRDTFVAIRFDSNNWITIHAGGEARSSVLCGTGLDAEDARFSHKLVGVGDCFGDPVDFHFTGWLARDEGNRISAHRMDGETCDIGGSGIAGF